MGNNLPITQTSKTLQDEQVNFSLVSSPVGYPTFKILNLYRREITQEEVMIGILRNFDVSKSNIEKREKILSPGLINIYHSEIQNEKVDKPSEEIEKDASCFLIGGR